MIIIAMPPGSLKKIVFNLSVWHALFHLNFAEKTTQLYFDIFELKFTTNTV